MNDDYFICLNEFSKQLDFVECVDVDVDYFFFPYYYRIMKCFVVVQ